MELKTGLIGVSLKLLPFWGAQEVQTPEAEGIVKPIWLCRHPVQKQACRLSLAADVHAQGWTWEIGVHALSHLVPLLP